MGLNINATKLLMHLAKEGMAFGKVLTLGRQRLNLTKRDLQRNLYAFGYEAVAAEVKSKSGGYCENFLELLGADQVHSMDVSGYENATLLHDLNDPVGHEVKGSYDTIIDSGTLEHVFNFPVAIKNCMELLRTGGNYIGITPCNNFFGHGFYQFSPELYYRIFSQENGFEVKKLYFFVDDRNTSFYKVTDPAAAKERVILNNVLPSYLLVVAHKISNEKIFSTTPQQSDYEHIIWKKEKASSRFQKFIPKPLRKMPRSVIKMAEGFALMKNDAGTADSRFFKKVVI